MVHNNLRQKIIIQTPSSSVDSRGQISGAWTNLATRFAQVRKMSGREATASNQLYASATWRVRMRWERDLTITTEYRIQYGSIYLNIGSITNVKERNKEIELLCSEVV